MSEMLVNIGWGNKALSESMLTYHQVINKVLRYSFKVNVYSNTQEINIQILFEIYTFELAATFPVEYELLYHNLKYGNFNSHSLNTYDK